MFVCVSLFPKHSHELRNGQKAAAKRWTRVSRAETAKGRRWPRLSIRLLVNNFCSFTGHLLCLGTAQRLMTTGKLWINVEIVYFCFGLLEQFSVGFWWFCYPMATTNGFLEIGERKLVLERLRELIYKKESTVFHCV